ncbi:hypothetical protein [Alkalihalobacillus sp. AL-G]|uniref:hypothetical protein n=1 Tax=Alkalihalobacillus sp. AL-G TaxID=2926399 RepID=UPI00272A8B3B|nr:hypothetical protein [Alkalihalobacillus sp. AL-G]WLD93044.1 hypothetical protein MOJ78_18915 [Alkalihalobacillus sp. AL-G]
MENNNLDQLKQSLDATVFNKNPYDEHTEQKLIERLRKERRNSKGIITFFANVYKPALSVIGLLAFCSVLFFMVNGEQSPVAPSDDPQPAIQDPENDPPPEDEVEDKLTKEQIYEKMQNSAKYFNTAEGKYTIKYLFEGGMKASVEFAVRHGENQFYIFRAFDEVNHEILHENMETTHLYHLQQEYSQIQHDSRLVPHQLEHLEYIYPASLAEKYLQDFDSWTFEESYELGDQRVVPIEGAFETEEGEEHSVKILMLEQTGILLKVEVYDENGDLYESMEMDELALNTSIEESRFNLTIPENYSNKNEDETAVETTTDNNQDSDENKVDEKEDSNEVDEIDWATVMPKIKEKFEKKEEVTTVIFYGEGMDIIMYLEVNPDHFDKENLQQYGLEVVEDFKQYNPNIWQEYDFVISIVNNQVKSNRLEGRLVDGKIVNLEKVDKK